jgi:hypothetical protein
MSDPLAYESSPTPSNGPLVARADFQYRWRVYAIFILLFGYGLWSARDGFIKWPEENRQNEEKIKLHEKAEAPHNYASILINQVLGVVLPGVSLPLFIWLMYRSRGAYRLEGNTLYLPGRQPIPVEKIQSLDKSRWDKKGIAVVEYQDSLGASQTATMRDMVYERRTTDLIVERLEKALGGSPAANSGAAPQE